MSAPKVKASDAASIILGFLLACCSEKATGNRKNACPTENWFEVSRTQSKGSARGAVSRFSPCNELAPPDPAGAFSCPRRTGH